MKRAALAGLVLLGAAILLLWLWTDPDLPPGRSVEPAPVPEATREHDAPDDGSFPRAFPIRADDEAGGNEPTRPFSMPDARDDGDPPGLLEDDCGKEVVENPLDPEIPIQSPRPSPIDNPRATFILKFLDEVNPHGLMSAPLMPGEEMEIETLMSSEGARFEAAAEGGVLTRLGPRKWIYRAPDVQGHQCITVTEMGSGESICLNVLVMVPYDGREVLNGYRIGDYETMPLRGDPTYDRPRGLVEVTRQNLDTWLTPHFRLSQFVSKQPAGFPRYVLISPRMLLKLEMLLEQVQEMGISARTFHVMSGYRTPYYNRTIGNTTSYSRHAYGDAADIFIDDDGDGVMDDLDGDGRITPEDAKVLYAMVEEMYGETWYMPFVGGMGLYGPAPHRGPFVHVDTRGFRVRW